MATRVSDGRRCERGVTILDDALIQYLNVHKSYIQAVITREKEEIEKRERMFRNKRGAPVLSGGTVILVDDGAATGSTMLSAVAAVRKQRPEKVIVAVPIAFRSACESFEREADDCFCLATPEPFVAVGSWYESFPQITDEEVKDLLFEAPELKSEQQGNTLGALRTACNRSQLTSQDLLAGYRSVNAA
jgi:putative phosphoribosyl transferase